MSNDGNWLTRMVRFTGWNLTVSQAINPLPYVVQAPRLFAREISFGDVIQSATAFVTIHNGLSFFRGRLRRVCELPGCGDPPDGPVQENARARRSTQVTTEARRTAAWPSKASRCERPTAPIFFGRLTSAFGQVTRC